MAPVIYERREAWRRIPLDDAGYFDAGELMLLEDSVLYQMTQGLENRRYRGWRNANNMWREYLGMDSITGKRVLDYGCGLGLDALQYARNGNEVAIADQNEETVHLASRIMRLQGYPPYAQMVIDPAGPSYLDLGEGQLDLIVMSGVIHHIEDPRPVLEAMHEWLAPGGEVRVMAYTDIAWRSAALGEPPEDVHDHPDREKYVSHWNEVGDWADWYNGPRLASVAAPWFRLQNWVYIAGHGQYGIGILERQ